MTLTMQKFTTLSSVAAPIMQVNIDTDAIIPSREMKGVTKDGLSVGMFANWRYTDVDARVENPDFILNKPPSTHSGFVCGHFQMECDFSVIADTPPST